jgi:hypothetical protein
MIDILFKKIVKRLEDWLEKKPTGRFTIEINVNQGGVRGKPKIYTVEDL